MTGRITEAQAQAVADAVKREVHPDGSRTGWEDSRGMTLEALCAANQDAFIDDLGENPRSTDPEYRAEVLALIAVYDTLLGTRRVLEPYVIDAGGIECSECGAPVTISPDAGSLRMPVYTAGDGGACPAGPCHLPQPSPTWRPWIP